MIQPKSCAPDLLTRPSNSPCSSARTHSRLISRLVLLTLKYLCVLGPRLLVNVRNSFVLKDFSPTNWQFLGGFGKGAGAADDGHQKNAESCNNELLQKVPRSVAVLYECGRDDECSQNQRLKAQLRVKQMLQQYRIPRIEIKSVGDKNSGSKDSLKRWIKAHRSLNLRQGDKSVELTDLRKFDEDYNYDMVMVFGNKSCSLHGFDPFSTGYSEIYHDPTNLVDIKQSDILGMLQTYSKCTKNFGK